MSSWLGHSKDATLNAADEELVLEVGNRNSCCAVLNSGGAGATLTALVEISGDGGSNYEPWVAFQADATPAPVTSIALAAATLASTLYYIPLPGGVTHVRIRLSAYTSGALVVVLRAVDSAPGHVLATLVDSSGVIGGGVTITPGSGASDLGKAEDAVHASGDVGVMELAVRQDAPTSMAAAGDYHPKTVDAAGAEWVRGRSPNTLANGQVATSTSSAELVAARAQRSNVTIKNLDGSITVWIGTGTVATNNGMELKAGESITLVTSAAINGRSASATPSIAYLEEYFS